MSGELERREVLKFGPIYLAEPDDDLLVDGSGNTLGWDGYFSVSAWILTAARKITSFLAKQRETEFSTRSTKIVHLNAVPRTTSLKAHKKTTYFKTE